MSNNKKIHDIWNQVPPDYYEKGINANIFQRIWHTKKLSIFKDIINGIKCKKILDVGCAAGNFTNNISHIFPRAKITGIDAYSRAIEYGKNKYPHINFILADAHNLPFKNNSFDLIICYETIEHIIDPLKALKEMRRVLRNDGNALVVMDSGSLFFRIVWWVWKKTKGKVWQGAHLHPFNHHQLGILIKNAGFKISLKKFSHLGMDVSFVLKK